MASVPATQCGLGRFVELGELPRLRDGLGTDALAVCLAKSVGAATDTTLRNCTTWGAMVTAGLVEADFTGYAPKVLGTADRTITYVTASSPFKATLTLNANQVWNPAGGATNNAAIVKGVLLYRPTTGTAQSLWRPLGFCDATGGATGGTYTLTFSPLTAQAT